MKNNNSLYLNHILDAINQVEKYIDNIKKEQFLKETLIQDGVIRQIEIIGEATKHLSSDLRKEYAHVPWPGYCRYEG